MILYQMKEISSTYVLLLRNTAELYEKMGCKYSLKQKKSMYSLFVGKKAYLNNMPLVGFASLSAM